MNKDFPRILALLRKERHINQKQAAAALNVTQALLSHYEKGKRECGLDFLVRVADYYNVSADYLLGRTAATTGTVIKLQEMPDAAAPQKTNTSDAGSFSLVLGRKLALNSIDIIFTLLQITNISKLTAAVTNIITLSVYKAFRLVYSAGKNNKGEIFSVGGAAANRLCDAALAVAEGNAVTAIGDAGEVAVPETSTITLERDFGKQAVTLLNLVKSSEQLLKRVSN